MTSMLASTGAVDSGTASAGDPSVKLIAFYLPQFHPIPENDLWWGDGFTDWTNVRRARAWFKGHYQPQLPTELSFYDLRDAEVLERQAALACKYGVHGFCFHYYWFDGRRLLERPLDDLVARGSPDVAFCCCWANEHWTRRWDGLDRDVLIAQTYQTGWEEAFIRDLLPVLTDSRYVRVRGAPLLLVYRVDELPDAPRAVERWREIARAEAGLELHLAAVQSFEIDDPRPYGFDAAVEFPPHPFARGRPAPRVKRLRRGFEGVLESYEDIVREHLARPLPEYTWYRGLMPSWDNTARRGGHAYVAVGASPDAYRRWLTALVEETASRSRSHEPLLFVNAWNEWAEGTHLEPDDRYAREWLEATRAGLAAERPATTSAARTP
jgi:lipopolysaccharide biosynthesis protein